jgi:hypothetical protein
MGDGEQATSVEAKANSIKNWSSRLEKDEDKPFKGVEWDRFMCAQRSKLTDVCSQLVDAHSKLKKVESRIVCALAFGNPGSDGDERASITDDDVTPQSKHTLVEDEDDVLFEEERFKRREQKANSTDNWLSRIRGYSPGSDGDERASQEEERFKWLEQISSKFGALVGASLVGTTVTASNPVVAQPCNVGVASNTHSDGAMDDVDVHSAGLDAWYTQSDRASPSLGWETNANVPSTMPRGDRYPEWVCLDERPELAKRAGPDTDADGRRLYSVFPCPYGCGVDVLVPGRFDKNKSNQIDAHLMSKRSDGTFLCSGFTGVRPEKRARKAVVVQSCVGAEVGSVDARTQSAGSPASPRYGAAATPLYTSADEEEDGRSR